MPSDVPIIMILAPMSGSPLDLSVRVPSIFPVVPDHNGIVRDIDNTNIAIIILCKDFILLTPSNMTDCFGLKV
jgi:hypothetical protein